MLYSVFFFFLFLSFIHFKMYFGLTARLIGSQFLVIPGDHTGATEVAVPNPNHCITREFIQFF